MKSSRGEQERYYLLPGMGGQAWRQKTRSMALWGILAGLLVSGFVAALLYALNRLNEVAP